VLKDPRVCRRVPLYRWLLGEMGADVRVVLALRDPAAVAASLHRRNQLSAGYAGLLWASHMLAAERDTRDLPRIAVDYDDLVANPRAAARRVAGLLAGAVPPVDADRIHRRCATTCATTTGRPPAVRPPPRPPAAGPPRGAGYRRPAGAVRRHRSRLGGIAADGGRHRRIRFQTLTRATTPSSPASGGRAPHLAAALDRLHRAGAGNASI
jgi:hypothetical protein